MSGERGILLLLPSGEKAGMRGEGHCRFKPSRTSPHPIPLPKGERGILLLLPSGEKAGMRGEGHCRFKPPGTSPHPVPLPLGERGLWRWSIP